MASCVDYLKQLGITHVQILPMYDFASVDETNVSADAQNSYSLGYDPKNYNVPEGSYSSDPYDGNVRITEMKEMIQALHDAGIKVIMDVAYSHTSDVTDSNFNKIMPGYYYKLNDDLTYNDQSGYGNATRSESAMFRKFMIDSVSYWAEEYNLDGFRFDLMGIHDVTTMNQIRKELDSKFGKNTIVLYGEGRTGGDGTYDSNSAHKANESKLDYGIGYYNEQIKEGLKGGDTFDGTIGLVQAGYVDGAYLEPNVKWPNNVFGGIMGSVGYTSGEWGMWRPFWSKSSNCCLSYVSAHDNLTLWDKLAEGSERDFASVDDKMLRMNKMAGSVVLVSKGGVFMQAGEEFARTKNGEDNSQSSSGSVNKIDWNRVNTYSDIQQYYQGMIRIRKAFSGFRSILTRGVDNWAPENNNIEWISKEEAGMTAFYETNDVPGEWNRIAVLINNAVSDQTVDLTASDEWVMIADGTKAGVEKIKESGSDITVSGKSVVVAVPKDTFEENHVSKNEPPVITCDTSFRVSSDEILSFTVETSDPEGDAVTLEADGIPEGASFDVTTGVFRWEDPAVGEYTVTLTARDNKTAVTKTVTIIVTLGLKDLIRQAEEKNYQKKDFTEEIYQSFENALANAREVADRNETDDVKIQAALHDLSEAYENINREAAAKEGLAEALEKAKTRLAAAEQDPANYEAEAAADLKTVISDAEEFIKMVHSTEEYLSKEEDLEYAVKACKCLTANPLIRIKADDWRNPAVYVWTGEGDTAVTFTESWPGTKLTEKDREGWFILKLPEGTSGYSLIVNDGTAGTATRTADIAAITGSVDVTVTSFSGNACTYTKREYAVEGGASEPDKTALGVQITKAENVINENPAKPNEVPEKPGGNLTGPGGELTIPGTKPSTEEPVRKLEIANVTIGKASGTAQVGDTISISVQSTGGTGIIKYRFLVKKSFSTVIGDDSISSSAKWRPKKAGKYSITVYAKDDGGNAAEKTITSYTVNKKLKVSSFKASPASKKAKAGQKVKLTVKASGGTKKYRYKFRYKRSGTKKIKGISNYRSKKAANWRPKESGRYTLYVYVRDKTTKRTAKKIIRNYIVS